MKKFESYEDALADAADNGYRELKEDEDFSENVNGSEIASVHTCGGGGYWTWCPMRDMHE